MTRASEPEFISRSQLPQIISNAGHGQTFFVRTYHVRQVAEHLARDMGREDLKFIVKREDNA